MRTPRKLEMQKTKSSLVQGPRFSSLTPLSHFGWSVFAFLAFWRPTDYVYKIWLSLVERARIFIFAPPFFLSAIILKKKYIYIPYVLFKNILRFCSSLIFSFFYTSSKCGRSLCPTLYLFYKKK